MYTLKIRKAEKDNYGRKRAAKKIKYLVFHSSGNISDSAEAVAEYYASVLTEDSFHYIVDDKTVYRSVPELQESNSLNATEKIRLTVESRIGRKLFGKCTNENSINIAMCCKNGKHTYDTIANAYLLGEQLAKKYKIKEENIVRHFDVDGHICPSMMVKNEELWKEFQLGMGYTPKEMEPKIYEGTMPVLPSCGYFTSVNCGYEVKRLQKALNWALNTKLEINGQYNDSTVKVVRRFQKMNNWTPDGLFDIKAWTKLNKMIKGSL